MPVGSVLGGRYDAVQISRLDSERGGGTRQPGKLTGPPFSCAGELRKPVEVRVPAIQ